MICRDNRESAGEGRLYEGCVEDIIKEETVEPGNERKKRKPERNMRETVHRVP